jgi:AcrR family transcriptional regulator
MSSGFLYPIDLRRSRVVTTTAASDAAPATVAAKPARQRILDAASALFYAQGIRAVGIESVVEAAGVAKMSLYRCFASKDALIVAFLEDRDQAYWRWWDEVTALHPGAPRRQLLALFEALGRRAVRPGYRGCPFVNTSSEFPDSGHPGRKVIERHTAELRTRLSNLAIALGAAAPGRLADQLILLIEGAYASSQTMGPAGPAAEVAAAAEVLIDAHTRGAAAP